MSSSEGVSVVIPVFNGERFLSQAIHSVLQQNWSPSEVIVIDDGSTDRSADIAEGFGSAVTCIRRPHCGLAASRNAGILSAKHPYILPFDSDDVMCDNSITVRIDYLRRHPECEILIGWLDNFADFDHETSKTEGFAVPTGPKQGHVAGTSLIRRSVFEKIGDFDESIKVRADFEWIVRCRQNDINIHHIENLLIKRRIHGKNHSMQVDQESITAQLRVLKASLDRKRNTVREN